MPYRHRGTRGCVPYLVPHGGEDQGLERFILVFLLFLLFFFLTVLSD